VTVNPFADSTAREMLDVAAERWGERPAMLFGDERVTFAEFRERVATLAGGLVALYISVEAPISGMSMNPARTFGSALPAGFWEGWWIYFLAPPLGMLLATELYRRLGGRADACAKLHHTNDKRCVFCGKPACPR